MKDKEIKHFFQDEKNVLNKGHLERDQNTFKQGIQSSNIRVDRVLPPLEVISEYETLYPGSLEKAIHITQKEQSHRHETTQRALIMNARARTMGQLFGLISFLSICFVSVKLAMLGLVQKAIYMSIIYLTCITLVSIFGIYAEKASRMRINRSNKNRNKGDFRKKH